MEEEDDDEVARVLAALEASLNPDLIEEAIWKMSPSFAALLSKHNPPKCTLSSLRKTIAKRIAGIETSLSNMRTLGETLASMTLEMKNDAIYKSASGRLVHAKRLLQRECGAGSLQVGESAVEALRRDLNMLCNTCPSLSFGAASLASGKAYEKRVERFVRRLPILKELDIIPIFNINFALEPAKEEDVIRKGFREIKECDIIFTRHGRLLGIGEVKTVPEDGPNSLDKLFPYIDDAAHACIVDRKDVLVTPHGLRNHLLIIPQDTALPLPSHQFKKLQHSPEYSLAVVKAHEKLGNIESAHAAMSTLKTKVRDALIQGNRDFAKHIDDRTRRGLPPIIPRIVLQQEAAHAAESESESESQSAQRHQAKGKGNGIIPITNQADEDARAAQKLSEALLEMMAVS